MNTVRIAFLAGAIVAAGYLLSGLPHSPDRSGIDSYAFGLLPVQSEGRIKPLDSLGRQYLLQLHERQSLELEDGTTLSASQWVAEVMLSPEKAARRNVITIRHPDLVTLVAPPGSQDRKHFSLAEIFPNLKKLVEQAQRVSQVEAQLRNPYQKEVIELSNAVTSLVNLQSLVQLPQTGSPDAFYRSAFEQMKAGKTAFDLHQKGQSYNEEDFESFLGLAATLRRLDQSAGPRLVPPREENGQAPGKLDDWWTVGAAVLKSPVGDPDPVVLDYGAAATAYRNGEAETFNEAVERLREETKLRAPDRVHRAELEAAFNHSELFYRSSALYVLAFVLVILSWLKWPRTLGTAAAAILVVTLVAHTAGLGIRMYLHGRPPVTNLYSSAVFVGWGAVWLGLILERFFKNGIGSACAASIGFMSLIVAHHLAAQGDTLAMLQAVLDTNFWLATHVVVITLGYSATFLGGFLGIIYVLRGFFSRSLDSQTESSLQRMVYGIICFGTLFSLIGTLLGGIWADQSWGRFWGWDPKENGALLIVLWNAVILHARWGKLIQARGLMVLAILGNIVTAWSWFGTNMLGVGLHSYGFMDEAFFWLAAFVFFQLMFAAIGLVPLKHWGSFEARHQPEKDRDAPASSGSSS